MGRPEAPAFVESDPIALAEWNMIVPQLEQMGTLAKVHRMLVANYCLCAARLQAAQELIDEHGLTYETEFGPRKRPEVVIVEKCTEQIKAYMAEMCITQGSQSRAVAKKPERKTSGKERFFG